MTSLVPEMFEQTCRTCLNTNGEMVQIFSSDFYVNQLPKKLMAFTEVEISDNDDLPKTICKKCIFMADSFYCFKEQCEAADNRLKSLIRRSPRRDDSSKGEKKLDSEDGTSNENSDVVIIANFNEAISNDRNVNREAKNVIEIRRETKDNYDVEYISEEVRIEVENAAKRRLEVERRIGMKKVSESIKNLKGIEVVPIGDINATRNGRNNRSKNEELVVFPVKVSTKRCKVVETIVVDDDSPLNKRLRLPPETTVSKIDGGDVKRKDFIVYGEDKKLNFSTVRQVVKINDKELCVEPKEEFVKESDRGNDRIKYDTDVVVARNDNDKENPLFVVPEIPDDRKGSEINSEKLEPDVLEVKIQEEKQDEEKDFKTQLLGLLDVISVDSSKNIIKCNGNKKSQNIFNQSNSTENEKKSTYCPSTMEEPVKILAGLKSKLPNSFENHDTIAKSTIGCTISGIDDQNFDVIDQEDKEEDVLSFGHANEGCKSFIDYRTDRSNEVFIENEVGGVGDNCVTRNEDNIMKSICLRRKNCSESSEIDRNKVNEDLKLNLISIAGNRRGNSDEVTPLALLSVNSPGEENTTINLKIYKRNETEKNSSVKDKGLVSSAHQNPGNSDLKFYLLCLICDKSFQDERSFREHVVEHNGSKPYKCEFCPKTFSLKRNLKLHVNHHIDYKPFQCRICENKFTDKSSLKSHALLHAGESPFECKTCNVSFDNKINWRKHVISVHEKLTVVCRFCNKELPDKRYLQVHMRIHTGDRPYQCPHCDKKFTQQCNLKTHIHCHLNDRPFGCPHCGKGFNQQGTRDDHILTHTGEKPHRCKECDASFTVSSALKRHMWIHTDKDRPHVCEKCKLQFVGLYDLRRHLKIKHGKIFKPENPRVERVTKDDRKEKAEGFGSEFDLNKNGSINAVQSSLVLECRKAEITAKENSSLSCNVNKFEGARTDEIKESFSERKVEIFNNGEEGESIDNFEISICEDGTQISGPDVSGR